MARRHNPWDDFKTRRGDDGKSAGLVGHVLIVLFCALLGAGIGFMTGIYIVGDMMVARSGGAHKMVVLVPTGLGALIGAGASLWFLVEEHRSNAELQRIREKGGKDNDRPCSQGPFL